LQEGAEQRDEGILPCPRLNIRFGGALATILDKTIKDFGIILRQGMSAVAAGLAQPPNEELHAEEFSVFSPGAFFSFAIEHLGEVLTFLQLPMRVRFIIVIHNVLLAFAVASLGFGHIT
jgi:hypothetical protein